MKLIYTLFLPFCLIYTLTGCVQKQGDTSEGHILNEVYSGVVVNRVAEGSGSELKDCLEVDIDGSGTMVFAITDSTEISGSDTISIGDRVEIECGVREKSNTPSIIKAAVFPVKYDLAQIIMVDGKLYYDTGKESSINGRCGNMDGEITSSVDSSEIPTKNDQSNFGRGYGYQYGMNGTIEVSLNDKWFIFEQRWLEYIFDDSERAVKFSIKYPESWELTEQRGYDGDAGRDASPSAGVSFTFQENNEDIFSIMAALFVPFEVDETLFIAEPFETNTGLTGTQYMNDLNGRLYVYFIFGDGETLPQYFAAVNMSPERYEAEKEDIEAVVRSLRVLTD